MRSIFIRIVGWGFENLKRYAESAPAVAFIDRNIFGLHPEGGLQIDVCGFAEGAGVDGVAHTGTIVFESLRPIMILYVGRTSF